MVQEKNSDARVARKRGAGSTGGGSGRRKRDSTDLREQRRHGGQRATKSAVRSLNQVKKICIDEMEGPENQGEKARGVGSID